MESSLVYDKQRPESIQAMFDHVAKNYDRGNAILSFGLHKWWDASLVRTVVAPKKPSVYLDLCAGTGAISFRYLRRCKKEKPRVILLDFSEQMLAYAKEKAGREGLGTHHLEYMQADAQEIPLPDSSVDCVTVAYGIRNVKDPEKCISDVVRVLRPGGVFGILELTCPENGFLNWGHKIYLKSVLPLVGRCVLGSGPAYEYLCGSIQAFAEPVKLMEMMRNAGLTEVSKTPLLGGVATIIRGVKA